MALYIIFGIIYLAMVVVPRSCWRNQYFNFLIAKINVLRSNNFIKYMYHPAHNIIIYTVNINLQSNNLLLTSNANYTKIEKRKIKTAFC